MLSPPPPDTHTSWDKSRYLDGIAELAFNYSFSCIVNCCFTDVSFAQLHGEILPNCPFVMFRMIGSLQCLIKNFFLVDFPQMRGIRTSEVDCVLKNVQLSHLMVNLNTCVF